jgi:hypothetical protein
VAFSAVLDANVLYPFSLRDTLLRLAELELFTALWSTRILEEMRRNLVEHRITAEQADRIEEAMRKPSRKPKSTRTRSSGSSRR